MHDPHSLIFTIPNIFIPKGKYGYRPDLIRVWHVDPEKDGTDDSCGMFIRHRHLNKALLAKVVEELKFQCEYMFDNRGYPKYSVISIALQLYRQAAWVYFRPNEKKFNKFFSNHLHDCIFFAENPIDSLHSSISKPCKRPEEKEYRIKHLAAVILADICTKDRKWYQHPRWHIHHWEIQWIFIEQIKYLFKKGKKQNPVFCGKEK